MKKKIVIGNWKMNPVREKDAENLLKSIAKGINNKSKTDIVVCPPFLYIESLEKISKKVMIGAQNVSTVAEKGAYTGEISSSMLYNVGAKYAIVGHSERRAMGENNIDVNNKVKVLISAGLCPILCVGEITRDESHDYFNLVKTQIIECLKGVPKNLIPKVIVAYEPVWALSTTADRRDATPLDCFEMVMFIRKILSDMTSPKIAGNIRVIYGGSVNESDAADFIDHGGVDGLLVGRASLDAKKFLKIVEIVEHI
jgi:triosephosphate isomerase (TIM)